MICIFVFIHYKKNIIETLYTFSSISFNGFSLCFTTFFVRVYRYLHTHHVQHACKTIMVYPSSAAVYGLGESLPNRENDALLPVSPYGMHKLMAENLCDSYARNFDISTVMVRFFSIYGDGLQKQLLWDACSKAARGDTKFSGSGAELRDWLHVEDAASLLEASISYASSSCPVVNGGSGTGLSVKNILSRLFSLYGSDLPCNFSGTSRPGDPAGYQADVSRLEQWGWRPEVDLDVGLARYISWFKSKSNG